MPLYGSVFVGLSLASFAVAAKFGGGWLLLVWPGLSFALVSVAYAMLEPRVVGKRADGTFPTWRRILLFPFFVYSEGIWHLYALFSSEEAYNQVAPGLWVGRWPVARPLPDGVDIVVDVTAELPAHRSLTRSKRYICLPALDATVPNEEDFRALALKLADERGGIFVHCAFGHGRSAMVAAAILITRGLAHDAESAERLMKTSRPLVGLTGLQRTYVERFTALRHSPAPAQ